MPTYDYQCKSCGHSCEVFQAITDNPKRKCPVCSKMTFKRLIGSGAGIIFKGSGFYETDYRSKSYQEGAKKDTHSVSSSSSCSSDKKSTSSSLKESSPKDKKGTNKSKTTS